MGQHNNGWNFPARNFWVTLQWGDVPNRTSFNTSTNKTNKAQEPQRQQYQDQQ